MYPIFQKGDFSGHIGYFDEDSRQEQPRDEGDLQEEVFEFHSEAALLNRHNQEKLPR